jgi:uncharacterized membrane protein
MVTGFPRRTPRGALVGPFLLGMGLGGLIDGILLHQVLQWHHMLSARWPATTATDLRMNIWADGLFHAGATALAVLGGWILWHRVHLRRPVPALREIGGGLMCGWGSFNLLEGVVNHHWLELHNVREAADPLLWNLAFLLLAGALPVFCGVWMIRGRFPG